MILVDYSNVARAVAAIELEAYKGTPESGMFRHKILNSLRANRMKFHDTYGELVICCDSPDGSWRHGVFEHYKGRRRQAKEESVVDWKAIEQQFRLVRDELAEFFPYPVVTAPRAEADDVIGALARINISDRMLILSGDADFCQLHDDPSPVQYSPVHKKWVICNDPDAALAEKVIRGDPGDGVPNILSDDDTFMVEGKRQKPLRTKDVERWIKMRPEDFCDSPATLSRWNRNNSLINLSCAPDVVKTSCLETYGKAKERADENGRGKLIDYFMHNRLRELNFRRSDF